MTRFEKWFNILPYLALLPSYPIIKNIVTNTVTSLSYSLVLGFPNQILFASKEWKSLTALQSIVLNFTRSLFRACIN